MNDPQLFNQYRIKEGPLASVDENGRNGAFTLCFKDNANQALQVVSGFHDGWEHVCVTRYEKRGLLKGIVQVEPTNEEMRMVKDLFFKPEETVVEFFPRQESTLHAKEGTRHLWRHTIRDFPIPEIKFVAPKQDADKLIVLPNGARN